MEEYEEDLFKTTFLYDWFIFVVRFHSYLNRKIWRICISRQISRKLKHNPRNVAKKKLLLLHKIFLARSSLGALGT